MQVFKCRLRDAPLLFLRPVSGGCSRSIGVVRVLCLLVAQSSLYILRHLFSANTSATYDIILHVAKRRKTVTKRHFAAAARPLATETALRRKGIAVDTSRDLGPAGGTATTFNLWLMRESAKTAQIIAPHFGDPFFALFPPKKTRLIK